MQPCLSFELITAATMRPSWSPAVSLLLLVLVGQGAAKQSWAIPMPDPQRDAEIERQRKQDADLVVDAEAMSETLFLIESKSNLPPFTADSRRELSYKILDVKRNQLQRPLPKTLAIIKDQQQELHRPTCEAKPTIDTLKGSLHCRRWSWQFMPPPVGSRSLTIPFTPNSKYRLWLSTNIRPEGDISLGTNQTFSAYAKAVDPEQTALTTAESAVKPSDSGDCTAPPIACLIAPCPGQQRSWQQELDCRLKTATAKETDTYQLILAGYITKKAENLHIVDAANYLTVMGINVLISGGILGNGGTDRASASSKTVGSTPKNRHFLDTSELSTYKLGDYVYLSCTATTPQPTSCGLDSAGKRILMAPTQTRFMAMLQSARGLADDRSR